MMDTATIGDATIEFQVRGSGEPLLLIHGAMIADAWEPIIDQLTAGYQVITYHRRGFCGSSPFREANTIAAEAADAVAVLDHLGSDVAHVAGHSYGAAVALQLAVDARTRVHSVGLLEPALLTVPAGADFGAGVEAIGGIFASGDNEGALNAFLTAVGGENATDRLNGVLDEGWYKQALDDLPTLFAGDFAALGAWEYGEAEARSVAQPTLLVVGDQTAELFAQSNEKLIDWLPAAEPFTLADATHMLQMNNPADMGSGLIDFFAKHPIRS
jgi:pimeloyl-ACP methyl ester carboxylesterase